MKNTILKLLFGTSLLYGLILGKICAQNDARLLRVHFNSYSCVNIKNDLGVIVCNVGTTTITSLTIVWDDGILHESEITGLTILPGDTMEVIHPKSIWYPNVDEKKIEVTITMVNGESDSNMSDNKNIINFHTVSSIVQHNVLVEEGTGNWCGYCPRGIVAMEYMTNSYPDQFVGIVVHHADILTDATYDGSHSYLGFPTCNVDRVLLDQNISQSDLENYFNTRKDIIVPAEIYVSSNWNPTTRLISATVTAHFVTAFTSANFRLGIIVVEDGVTGTTSAYNQQNYYTANTYGPMGGFESLPDPVPASQMVYNYVGRSLLGGYSGQPGSVPAVIAALQNIPYSFNFTLPANYDETKIKLVGILIDQSTGEVVNVQKESLNIFGSLSDESSINEPVINIYPNPSSEFVNLQMEGLLDEQIDLTLYDLNGKLVYSQRYINTESQSNLIPIEDLTDGSYFVCISTKSRTYVKELMVKK